MPPQDSLTTPPAKYTIRKSARAKRISLRILPGKGLEVVLPMRVDTSCVPQIIIQHQAWIDKALARMAPEASPPLASYPTSFALKGGAEIVVIHSRSKGNETTPDFSQHFPLTPNTSTVTVPKSMQDASDKDICLWLREWVREEARLYLGQLLHALAQEHGFTFKKIRIGFQRTRWGSCSAKGTINLNACLLFLPEHLAKHILLHELCHTRQLNHGAGFWKLLFLLEPDALAKDKCMRTAWKYVPGWIFV